MKHSTEFVVLAVVIAAAWIFVILFLKGATDEPNVALEVSPKFWHTVKRGDLVTRRGVVYRVKAVRAPRTLIVRRER